MLDIRLYMAGNFEENLDQADGNMAGLAWVKKYVII